MIKLKEDGVLTIPVEYFSLLGRHSYKGEFYFRKNKSSEVFQIDFYEFIKIILDHLSRNYKTNFEQQCIFLERIRDSVSNIKSALEMRENDLRALYYKDSVNFKDAEQGLIIGHTFHPHPKNKDEFDIDDYKLYSPEAAGEFHLHWFLVHPDVVHSHISKNFEHKKWNEELFFKETSFSEDHNDYFRKGYVAYPMHPWQKKIILKIPLIKEYLQEGLLIDLGVADLTSDKWYPTSSLRSVYKETSQYMLKFSLSVRLTNSIRHLLPLEVVRGLQVMDVFSTEKGADFLKKYPRFHILFEPPLRPLLIEIK